MIMPLILREKMTNKYKIVRNDKDKLVSICIGDSDCSYLHSFLDIWVDDDLNPSPIKTIEDAEAFAEIIVKLLKVIT